MSMDISRRHILAGIVVPSLQGYIPSTLAQQPGQTRLIVPTAAGSALDLAQRALLPELQKALGAPAYVDNLPGGSTTIGTATTVRAAPDGNTLCIGANHHLIAPLVMDKLPYHPLKDITPISVLGTSPIVLVSNADFEPKNVPEMVKVLAANPGKFNYASPGAATLNELAIAMLFTQAAVKAVSVHYNGTGPQLRALLGGECQFGVFGLPSVQAQIKAGKLRALAVFRGTRSRIDPTIPTVAEQGLPGVVIDGWHMVFGPAKMPESVVHRIYAAYNQAIRVPEVRQQILNQGTDYGPMTPQESAEFLKSEFESYAAVVRAANLKVG